jgi:hypothetical protein
MADRQSKVLEFADVNLQFFLDSRFRGQVSSRQHRTTSDQSKELVCPISVSRGPVVTLYRCCWLIDLAFKRLKAFSNWVMFKKDPRTAQAWMHLKLLLALLVAELLVEANSFFLGIQPLRRSVAGALSRKSLTLCSAPCDAPCLS